MQLASWKPWALLALIAFAGSGSSAPVPISPPMYGGLKESYRPSRNGGREHFIVTRGDVTGNGTSALIGRMVQAESEYLYKRACARWLGREAPAGWMPVYVWHSPRETHLPRAFLSFDRKGKLLDTEIALVGDLDAALERQLPREMAKLVMGLHFHEMLPDQPRPRWVQLGAPIVDTLPSQEQVEQFDACIDYLRQANTYKLRELCDPKFPETAERNIVLAQGYTITQFLLTHQKRPQFLRFVELGIKENWDTAANQIYGFKSLDELEAAWLKWMQSPDSRPIPKK